MISFALRFVAVAVTLPLMFLLPPSLAFILFFALGFAHFAIAFWYQKDAKKWSARRLVTYIAAFFALTFFVFEVSYTLFLFATAFIFALHMMMDEVHLFKKQPSLMATLAALPFFILYTALLSDATFFTDFLVPAFVLAALAVLAYLLVAKARKHAFDEVTAIGGFWTLYAVVAYGLFASVGGIPSGFWFLGLTVMHYIIWYGEYWRRVANDPKRRATYLRRVALANGVTLAFALIWLVEALPALGIFFLPGFFYVWSFLHIVSSVRPKDLYASLRLS